MLLRPEVEGDAGEFVDERVGEAAFGQVDGLDIGVAGVAALDANVGESLGGVDRKFGVVLLAAAGANDAAELPFGEAETAEQAAAAAVPLRAEDGERGIAIAKRTEREGVSFELQGNARAEEFGVGLQEGESQEFRGIGGRVEVDPAAGEQVRPGT